MLRESVTESAARAMIAARPEDPAGYDALALIAFEVGRFEIAAELWTAALARGAGPGTRINLAEAWRRAGALDLAAAELRVARLSLPDYPGLHLNLGLIAEAKGDAAAVRAHAARALMLGPGDAGVLRLTARLWPRWDARAARADPADPDLAYNAARGALLAARIGDAETDLQRALALRPDGGAYWSLAGQVALYTGLPAVARLRLDHAARLSPDDRLVAANRLSLLAGLADPAADDLARQLTAPPPPRPALNRGARLKIGYVSPDFRVHSCAAFLAAFLPHHDPAVVEVTAYAELTQPDALTARFKGMVGRWRETAGVPAEELAALVRADGIDVLVDLASLAEGGRLDLFTLRPAALQVSWLGYNATTAVGAIDYKLVDAQSRPDDADEWFAESLLVLDRPAHVWAPLTATPDPIRRPGPPTFASFNNLNKLTADTVTAWAAILTRAPDARLLLKARQLGDPYVAGSVRRRFAAAGVDPARLDLIAWVDPADHFALYQQVDVALDPFPYTGVTTTLEALWMGVPVVTRRGRRLIERVGASLLGAIGDTPFIAASTADYIETAVSALSSQSDRAARRARLAASPLCDGPGFARALERTLRRMLDGLTN